MDKIGSSREKVPTEEVEMDGEKVLCKRVDMLKEYGEKLKNADNYRKIGKVEARQATEREEISTSHDGMKNYADPGDWIIHNPGDKDPYVFGSKNDPIEVRQEKFAKKYVPKGDEPGIFIPKGIIKAVRVNENLVFNLSWGGQMGVKAGGWVADGGYAIAENSFANTYEKIEAPSQKGDRVICHINGKDIKGVIFNDEFSGGNLVGILLDEKIDGSDYLGGYGATLGHELLNDPSMIEKTGDASNEEMKEIEDKLNNLLKK